MTLKAFRRLSRAMLGTGAITVAMLVAACGSSSSGNAGSSATSTSVATACSVSASDLQLQSSGAAAAPTKNPNATGSLQITGSTALQPLFQVAQPLFDSANGTKTNVGGGGSGTGLGNAESGTSAIGMSDLFAQEKSTTAYTDLKDHQVAAVIFTIVVNKDIGSTVTNLTSDQIKAIYSGTYTNWSQLGGPNEAINVIVRTSGSGTRFTFDKYVLGDPKASDQPAGAASDDSTGQLVTDIGSKAGSIGYLATSFVLSGSNPNVVPVCIDGGKPTVTDINSNKYQFWSFEHAYTKGRALGYGSSVPGLRDQRCFPDNSAADKGLRADQANHQPGYDHEAHAEFLSSAAYSLASSGSPR